MKYLVLIFLYARIFGMDNPHEYWVPNFSDDAKLHILEHYITDVPEHFFSNTATVGKLKCVNKDLKQLIDTSITQKYNDHVIEFCNNKKSAHPGVPLMLALLNTKQSLWILKDLVDRDTQTNNNTQLCLKRIFCPHLFKRSDKEQGEFFFSDMSCLSPKTHLMLAERIINTPVKLDKVLGYLLSSSLLFEDKGMELLDLLLSSGVSVTKKIKGADINDFIADVEAMQDHDISPKELINQKREYLLRRLKHIKRSQDLTDDEKYERKKTLIHKFKILDTVRFKLDWANIMNPCVPDGCITPQDVTYYLGRCKPHTILKKAASCSIM